MLVERTQSEAYIRDSTVMYSTYIEKTCKKCAIEHYGAL